MATPTFGRSIRIDEDGTASYERRAIILSDNGAPAEARVLETKRVDAGALFAESGELFVLPPRCRLARQEGAITVLVIEDPPAVRSVNWDTTRGFQNTRERLLSGAYHTLWGEQRETFACRIGTQTRFRLAFPYLVRVYCFVGDAFSAVYCYYRTAPIRDERPELLLANLPNQHPESHSLCLTDVAKQTCGKSFAEMVANIEAEFWNGSWNHDWMNDFLADAARIPEVASPWEWERATAVDPTFVLRAPWRSTELTLGEAVRRLLGLVDRRTPAQTFAYFAKRVQAADPYERPAAATASGVRQSPAAMIMLQGNLPLSIGDEIIFNAALFPECVPGTPYPIEWFGTPDLTRLVKLVGIERPLPLIVYQKILSGAAARVIRPPEPVRIAGFTLGQHTRTLVRFTDSALWERKTISGYLAVTECRRGLCGEVLVKFKNEDFFAIIGTNEELLPGVELIQEEVDAQGFLRGGEFRLADGTIIRQGDVLYNEDAGFGAPFRSVVHRFMGLVPGENGHRLQTADGAILAFEQRDGALACYLQHYQPVAEAVAEVARSDGVRFRIGDAVRYREHIKRITAFSPVLRSSSRYCLLEDIGWRALVTEGKINDNVQPVPALRVYDNCVRLGDARFRRGEWLLDSKNCALFRTEGFIQKTDAPGSVDLVTADGSRREFIVRYELVAGLRRAALGAASGTDLLYRGTRLRLRRHGGSALTGKRFRVYCMLPGTGAVPPVVVTTSGLGFSLTAENAAYFEIRTARGWRPLDLPAHPTPAGSPTLGNDNFERIFTLRRLGRCVNPGMVVGKDRNGREVKIGDHVRITLLNLIEPYMNARARDLSRVGHAFQVVHADGTSGKTYLYLHAGRDIGQRLPSNTPGHSSIPREIAEDPWWWKSVCLEALERCELVA